LVRIHCAAVFNFLKSFSCAGFESIDLQSVLLQFYIKIDFPGNLSFPQRCRRRRGIDIS
jgi:hypothetical protein